MYNCPSQYSNERNVDYDVFMKPSSLLHSHIHRHHMQTLDYSQVLKHRLTSLLTSFMMRQTQMLSDELVPFVR